MDIVQYLIIMGVDLNQADNVNAITLLYYVQFLCFHLMMFCTCWFVIGWSYSADRCGDEETSRVGTNVVSSGSRSKQSHV
jgi:hypothetical protein